MNTCVTAEAVGAGWSGTSLNDDVLRQICGIPDKAPQITPEWIGKLRIVPELLDPQRPRPNLQLESALTLLASLLGQLKRFNPVHLPFGYEGPVISPEGWIDRAVLETVSKQIVGLRWCNLSAQAVANSVHDAVSEAVRLGFLAEKAYDAWRPGMRSGSGWRSAVTATPYGVTRVFALVGSVREAQPAMIQPRSAAGAETEDNPRADFNEAKNSGQDVRQARPDAGLRLMQFVGVPLVQSVTDRSFTAAEATSRNPRPPPRRGTRAANIEKLEKELEKHLLAARDHAYSLRDRGNEAVLLLRPTQKELAHRTGLSASDVSRCLKDQRATVLKILWETAESLEAVMSYQRRR